MNDDVKEIKLGAHQNLQAEFVRLGNLASIEYEIPLELAKAIVACVKGFLPHMIECKLDMDMRTDERAELAENRMDLLVSCFTEQWRAIGKACSELAPQYPERRIHRACIAIFNGMLSASMDELQKVLDADPDCDITIGRVDPGSVH